MIRIGLIGTNNTHGHQLAGFINGWSKDVAIPTGSVHRGFLPQFYDWAKVLRQLEESGDVPAPVARVTRLWSESPDTDGALIAKACGISELVGTPADAIRDVDAVLLLTGDPASHMDIASDAMRAGLPIFIDKPLAPDAGTAAKIADIAERRKVPWFSGSAFRFSPSLAAFSDRVAAEADTISSAYVQCSGWVEQYGIHALEIMNVLVGHQVIDMQGMSTPGRDSALITMQNGTTALLETINASLDPPAQAIVWGANGSLHWKCSDTHRSMYYLTKAFLDMIRTREPPVPYREILQMFHHAQNLTAVTKNSL